MGFMGANRFCMSALAAALLAAAASGPVLGADETEEPKSSWEQLKSLYQEKMGSSETEVEVGDEGMSGKIEAIKAYYRDSKESTTEMSKEAYEWLQDDIAKIGAWEYHVFSVDDIEDDEAQQTLATMGAERWELVSAVANDGRVVFVLKRPMKSYVKVLPAQDVLKLMGDISPEVSE